MTYIITTDLLIAALLVLLINLPFGFWRAGVKKFGLWWYLAIHVPIPFMIALRFLLGLGWHLITIPILAGAYFTGQLLGGKLRLWRRERCQTSDKLKIINRTAL